MTHSPACPESCSDTSPSKRQRNILAVNSAFMAVNDQILIEPEWWLRHGRSRKKGIGCLDGLCVHRFAMERCPQISRSLANSVGFSTSVRLVANEHRGFRHAVAASGRLAAEERRQTSALFGRSSQKRSNVSRSPDVLIANCLAEQPMDASLQ